MSTAVLSFMTRGISSTHSDNLVPFLQLQGKGLRQSRETPVFHFSEANLL